MSAIPGGIVLSGVFFAGRRRYRCWLLCENAVLVLRFVAEGWKWTCLGDSGGSLSREVRRGTGGLFRKLVANPVKQAALELGLPVIESDPSEETFVSELAATGSQADKGCPRVIRKIVRLSLRVLILLRTVPVCL